MGPFCSLLKKLLVVSHRWRPLKIIAEIDLVFVNSQLHKLNTSWSFQQNPQNPSVSVSSHPIILSLSELGSKRRRHSMCCPASRTHTADPPDWSLRLWRGSVLLCDSSLCARWLMCDVHPHRHLSKCRSISRRGLKSSPGKRRFVTIQLQLQIFSGTGGFEAIQTWWLPHGSRGADTELRPSMVSSVYLLSGRPSVEELSSLSTAATEKGWRAHSRLTFCHISLEV